MIQYMLGVFLHITCKSPQKTLVQFMMKGWVWYLKTMTTAGHVLSVTKWRILCHYILWVPEQMVVPDDNLVMSQSQCFMCLFHSTCGHRLDNTWFTDLKTWFLWSNTWYYSVSDDIIWENIPFLCEIFILFKATINSSIKLA